MSRAGAPAVAIICRTGPWLNLQVFSDQFTEGQKFGDNSAAARWLQQPPDYVAFRYALYLSYEVRHCERSQGRAAIPG
jgi:hypothetical protein